jgi:hypothetical protein
MRSTRRKVLIGAGCVALFLLIVGGTWLGATRWQEVPWKFRGDQPADCFETPGASRIEVAEVRGCLTDAVTKSVNENGLPATLTTVRELADDSRRVSLLCHFAMHAAGQQFARVGVGSALDDVTDWRHNCSVGFLHGYMQGLAETATSSEMLEESAAQSCSGMDGFEFMACAHGVGHAFARAADNRLKEAVTSCDRMPDSWDVTCTAGAVMELEFARDQSLRESGSDPGMGTVRKTSCADLPDRHAGACWARLVFERTNRPPDSERKAAREIIGVAFEVCGEIRGDARVTCMRAVGHRIAVLALVDPVKVAILVCGTALRVDGGDCAYGFGYGHAVDRVLDGEPDQAVVDCEQLDIAACFTGAGRALALVTTRERALTACNELDSSSRECIRDIGLRMVALGTT